MRQYSISGITAFAFRDCPLDYLVIFDGQGHTPDVETQNNPTPLISTLPRSQKRVENTRSTSELRQGCHSLSLKLGKQDIDQFIILFLKCNPGLYHESHKWTL